MTASLPGSASRCQELQEMFSPSAGGGPRVQLAMPAATVVTHSTRAARAEILRIRHLVYELVIGMTLRVPFAILQLDVVDAQSAQRIQAVDEPAVLV